MNELWEMFATLSDAYYEPGPGSFAFSFGTMPSLELLLNLYPPFAGNFAVLSVYPELSRSFNHYMNWELESSTPFFIRSHFYVHFLKTYLWGHSQTSSSSSSSFCRVVQGFHSSQVLALTSSTCQLGQHSSHWECIPFWHFSGSSLRWCICQVPEVNFYYCRRLNCSWRFICPQLWWYPYAYLRQIRF